MIYIAPVSGESSFTGTYTSIHTQPLACFKGPTQLPGEHTAELQFKISATGYTNTHAMPVSLVPLQH
jgi:hypothetical protein